MPRKEFLSLSKRHKRRLRNRELDRMRLSQNSDIYVDPVQLTINIKNELNYARELVVNDNENEIEKDVELRINPCIDIKANNNQSFHNVDINIDKVEYNSEVSELKNDFKLIIIDNNISQKVINDILKFLKKYFPSANLPKNARTLMRTPESTINTIQKINGGSFVYFGLKDGII